MGKKRAGGDAPHDDAGVSAPSGKKGKTRVSNFSEASTEDLLQQEAELAEKARETQLAVAKIRGANLILYGNNELRQLNTKRLRAEYAHAEVQRELARRRQREKEAKEAASSSSSAKAAQAALAAEAADRGAFADFDAPLPSMADGAGASSASSAGPRQVLPPGPPPPAMPSMPMGSMAPRPIMAPGAAGCGFHQGCFPHMAGQQQMMMAGQHGMPAGQQQMGPCMGHMGMGMGMAGMGMGMGMANGFAQMGMAGAQQQMMAQMGSAGGGGQEAYGLQSPPVPAAFRRMQQPSQTGATPEGMPSGGGCGADSNVPLAFRALRR
eukprot:TRINITY_DN2536_c0_g1_i1.p2 TRINITY_DN2536_c0_g1~~TRINITY_DN2536_c0_g1_i1.p2  ORF type:complete len:323 (+),score=97.30 TRINITY_DN2536_c0_g1_i1:49-1017(+)